MRIVSVGVEDAALTEPGVATRITLMAGPHLDCPAHDVVCVTAARLDGEWTLQLTTRTPDLIGAGGLSMGMSGDYEAAVEEGATVVRVGQAIFGARATTDADYWPSV